MCKPLNGIRSFFFACLLFASPEIFAARVGALLGFGSSGSAKDAAASEGPLLQSYFVEFDWDSRNGIGVEHTRSLNMSPLSTAISFTGLSYRYYLTSTPGPFNDIGLMPKNTIEFRDWAIYTGASFGLAQSSTPPTLSNESTAAAGVYLSPKLGLDYPMSGQWGFRTELIVNFQVFGAGSTKALGLGAGFYFLY